MTLLRRPTRSRYPICIHCSFPASTLYRRYTPSLVVLVRCGNPRCGRVVDSYADEEWRRPPPIRGREKEDQGAVDGKAWGSHGISWMDVILVKPRAYRHFLYNVPFLLPPPGHPRRGKLAFRQAPGEDEYLQSNESDDDWSSWTTVIKRFVALSLVDAYLKWFYLCAYPMADGAGAFKALAGSSPWWTSPSLLRTAGGYLRTPRLSTSTRLSTWPWSLRPRPSPSGLAASALATAAAAVVESTSSVTTTSDATQVMVQGYLMVWLATMAELLAFHATVTAGSAAWVGWQRMRRRRQSNVAVGEHQETYQDEHNIAHIRPHDGDEAVEGDDAFSIASSSSSDSESAHTAGPLDRPPPGVELLDLYRPQLISTALLLSSLSTLLLLLIVLLWESKLPRSGVDNSSRHHHRQDSADILAPQPSVLGDLLPSSLLVLPQLASLPLPTLSTDFAVRTLLGGLSAGVCLAVVHPRSPLLTTSLLLIGWTVASAGVRQRWTLLPSDAGPGGGGMAGWEGWRARGLYCDVR